MTGASAQRDQRQRPGDSRADLGRGGCRHDDAEDHPPVEQDGVDVSHADPEAAVRSCVGTVVATR